MTSRMMYIMNQSILTNLPIKLCLNYDNVSFIQNHSFQLSISLRQNVKKKKSYAFFLTIRSQYMSFTTKNKSRGQVKFNNFAQRTLDLGISLCLRSTLFQMILEKVFGRRKILNFWKNKNKNYTQHNVTYLKI